MKKELVEINENPTGLFTEDLNEGYPQEWHDLRRTGITGSDVAAIIGVMPGRSAMSVYMHKLGIKNVADKISERMYFGNIFENPIAQEYIKRSKNPILVENETLINKDNPLMIGNIDGWIGNKQGILECKNVGFFQKDLWGEAGSDEIPYHHRCQVAWYMAVCDVEFAHLAALGSGNEFRIYCIRRDKEFENDLIAACMGFWHNHIVKKIPPSDALVEDFTSLYPKDNGATLVADQSVLDQVTEIKELKQYKKQLDDTIKDLQVTIQAKLQENKYLSDEQGNVLISWATGSIRKKLDEKQLKQEHEDIYNKYLVEAEGQRRFLVK